MGKKIIFYKICKNCKNEAIRNNSSKYCKKCNVKKLGDGKFLAYRFDFNEKGKFRCNDAYKYYIHSGY